MEKLRGINHIVTHDHCADGILSAMVLHDVLPAAKITFCQYNTKEQEELEAKPGQLFCDFSPHKDRVKDFIDVGAIVLDHHAKQRAVIEAFGENGIFADEKAEPGVCGAVLAYRHVWAPLQDQFPRWLNGVQQSAVSVENIVKKMVTLAGIRDTWQKSDPRWVEACEQAEALRFWPLEYLLCPPTLWESKLEVGVPIFGKNLKYAEETAKTSYRFTTTKGTRVAIFQGLSVTSDAAEALDTLGEEIDLVVGFGYRMDDGQIQLVYSTRAHSEFDAGAFCVAHGGGGHTKAAGFTVKGIQVEQDPNPFQHFREILEVYEGAAPAKEEAETP